MPSTSADTAVSPETVATDDRDERRVSLFILCLMALGVGIMTGVGAVALRALIGLIHNFMINGVIKIPYDANILEGASRWGNWGHPLADPRRPPCRLSGGSLRAGSQGSWRPGGDGRHLLQARPDSRRRRGRQVARLGALDRLGRVSWPRGIPETIYTIKLRHRGHRIPKERHVNLYLVQQAQDIMERRFILAKAGSTLRECMGWEDVDDLRAIIVENEGRIVGLIPPRSGLWRESANNPNRLVDDFIEKRAVVCRDVDLLSLVLARLKRHRAGAAIVFKGEHRPRAADVVGVITKRAIADAVIDNYAD
jgi:hypothetical protein